MSLPTGGIHQVLRGYTASAFQKSQYGSRLAAFPRTVGFRRATARPFRLSGLVTKTCGSPA